MTTWFKQHFDSGEGARDTISLIAVIAGFLAMLAIIIEALLAR